MNDDLSPALVALPQLTELADRSPRGIATVLAQAVRAGELAPGDRLPTVREVATELGVSPATVSASWQALRRTGLVVSRGRAGTFVRDTPRPWLSQRLREMAGPTGETLRLDLSRGTPDPALLPSLGRALQTVSSRAATGVYQEEPVLPALREVLLAAWPYPVEAVTVVDGATDAMARALEQVVTFGDRVAVEAPGYPPLFDLLDVLGAVAVPVAMDGEGVRPDSLRDALAARPVAVVLQPRAQNPTGISMTPARAEQLAQLLARYRDGPLVLEDDHSGSISTAPDVSLGVYLPEQVVRMRSFSKSHGPDLRIAALGGPSAIVDRLVARRMLGPGWTSRMLQTILHDLLTRSGSMDEVAEARRQYYGRQRDVVARLAELGVVVPTPDGINLWLPARDERAALLHLAATGIRAAGGSPFLLGEETGAFIRVTTGLVTPDHSAEVATALAEAVSS